ncbi:hypothetical protein [Amycolatopsis sp. NPDC049159]|uniref:hypothetical protein n=1 Tax=Amycolatopsis sp. NPDC049159 TaxID=3157210 RepID=UPI0033EDC903
MPVWLQVTLPIFTAFLGGSVGFGFGRLNSALDRRQGRREIEAARRKADRERLPAFKVEHVSNALYRIVNVGDKDATAVHFSDRDESYAQIQSRPERIRLDIGSAYEFGIATADALPLPGRLLVMCDEFDEPKPVRVPLQ